jgi:hypothetical protein
MKASTEVAVAIDTTREMLQQVIISLDSLSARVDEMAADIARIKDVQNELRGGLALYERVKKFKEENFGVELKPSAAEGIDWDNVKAYCSNCTKMVSIVEPTSTLKDERIMVRAKCKICGAGVSRTLSQV